MKPAAQQQRRLTPITLAMAMAWPFVVIPIGMAALLALAAVSVGLDPAAFAIEFLADCAVILTPLGLKCLGIWLVYSSLYLVIAWLYWPCYQSSLDFDAIDPGLFRCFTHSADRLACILGAALSGWLFLSRRRSFWQGLRLAWHPGTHPQLE